MNISKGQRVALNDLGLGDQQFEIELNITGIAVDFSCFGLDSQGKLSNDAYMTFFNQPKTPCGAIELVIKDSFVVFSCQLSKLPSTIDRLVFAAAIDGNQTMKAIKSGYLKFKSSGKETGQFTFTGQDFQEEKALMLGEIYRKDGAWRFTANGQGFNGGLNALVKHFGGEVLEEVKPISIPAKTKETIQSNDTKVNLKKVTLSKSNDSINLTKHSNIKKITVQLHWNADVDLDLHAIYRTTNGKEGSVYFGDQGSISKYPFISLDQDAMFEEDNIENLTITKLDKFQCILIAVNIFDHGNSTFSFFNKSERFSKYDGFVILKTDVGDEIEVPLTSNEKGSWCVIAKIENTSSEIEVVNINKVTKDEPNIDNFY